MPGKSTGQEKGKGVVSLIYPQPLFLLIALFPKGIQLIHAVVSCYGDSFELVRLLPAGRNNRKIDPLEEQAGVISDN